MNQKKNERKGELFIFAEIFLFALFPIFLAQSSGLISPLFFAGLSSFFAGITFMIIAFLQKESFSLPKKAMFPAAMGILLVVILVNGLLFIGGQHTAPGNTALLIQSEVVFTFLFFGILGLERITPKRIFGSAVIVLGSIFILSNGFSGTLSKWDALILLAAAFAPLGNFFQKKTFQYISTLTYGIYRSIIGGILLCCISFLTENPLENVTWSKEIFFLILGNGILVLGISKWFWFEAIKRIGVSKSSALATTAPALTMIFAFLLLQEVPTVNQYIGLLGVIIGVPLILSAIPELIFTGKTKTGDGLGKKIGFPTINIEIPNLTPDKGGLRGVLKREKKFSSQPPKGVYAAYAEIDGKKYEGMLHCGPRPSMGKIEWRNEIHLLDFGKDSSGQTRGSAPTIAEGTPITLYIEKRIRRVKKFSSVEKLTKALENDKKFAKEFFASA